MLFSYGFIETSMASAKVLFLDLDIPYDDPLRMVKMALSTSAPGFRLFEREGRVQWESDHVWLACVNEEDGFNVLIVQTVDGKREPQSLWRGKELGETSELGSMLHEDPMWDVYHLRAVSLLQDRISNQLLELNQTHEEVIGTEPSEEANIRAGPWQYAMRLRELEGDLLRKGYDSLEYEVRTDLLHSAELSSYLPSYLLSLATKVLELD